MQAQLRRTYEFGPFHLDAGERLLSKDGQLVALTPKAFDTLLVLVENGGRLVDKEELIRSVWPDSFVEENSLNRSIYVLRKTLGELSGQAKYIETVPKRGYRFVASVTELETDEPYLILERHSSAEIITEEEEEASDSSNSEFENSPERATLAVARTGRFSRLRRHPLMVSGVVTVMLLAGVAYLWTAGKRGHAATIAKVKSIAVLPFNDLGARGNDDHLGLGMADVLITRLSNLKEVNVRPTSAVLKYDQAEDSMASGRSLGVDAVLEGSIYQVNDRIRVTSRLVRISDESTIWSGDFDENAKDVLAVQGAITEHIVTALALNLSGSEKEKLTKPYTDNADALQLYVKGRNYWNTRTWAGMDQAEYYFRRAIEKDPNFALAYVGLADRLFTNAAHPEAYSAVRKAIEIDPGLGEAYATLGFASIFQQWDWPGAEENFKRAIELHPGYGTAHQWYATLLAISGRVDEARREMQRALEIDPMSANFLADAGQMCYFAREYDEAEAYCRKAVEVTPDFIFAHMYLFDIYFRTGRHMEAFEEFLKWTKTSNSDAKYTSEQKGHGDNLRALYMQSGMNGLLRYRIDLILASHNPGYSYEVAKLHMLLGDKDHALAWLEKSCDNKDFLLPFLNPEPVFDDLRAEPRYQAVLRRMKLTPRNE